ncbi:hypothetical protein C2S53_008188 [Perilla frutescens var. hirtella]|uniref:3'-5' exonuclease domain-containing protein n=1 Tax=Perilla frutescens var. hirtella TaxID=608512 RepID=A0AAD4JET1_PERFH|nr:hypothetical protein C2S53_008188 [Perilla frutescens var. hirtella]
MAISIRDYNPPNGNYNLYRYDVCFFSDTIHTTVTSDPVIAGEWISEVQFNHCVGPETPIVGLDVEWLPTFGRGPQNPTATLQLCTGNRCLIYQLIHSSYIPSVLATFLSDRNITFVGVGIGSDLQRLWSDYTIGGQATRRVELGKLAAYFYESTVWERAGLKTLATLVLRKEVEKPQNVTLSRWDARRLTAEQVQYACVDAFVSLQIGKALNACSYNSSS